MKIALITGGAPHYEAGLISGLVEQGVKLDVVGGSDLESSLALRLPGVSFRNLYGSPSPPSSIWNRAGRIVKVYFALMKYAARSDVETIHIQWPYKVVLFDRTILCLYYKLLRKKLVFTAHNLDGFAHGKKSWINHLSLRFFYRNVSRLIVHTNRMKEELSGNYGIPENKIWVIPHGLMTAVPESEIGRAEARRRLGLAGEAKVVLAFGLISPYKGLELLVEALGKLRKQNTKITLVIAGRVKECGDYWNGICQLIQQEGLADNVIMELKHIPDEAVELYFKAADVLVMSYRNIFQSGVLFLAYRFGLPVIATNVGSLREDIVEGKTGFVAKANDPVDLAMTIEKYFASPLFAELESNREKIREFSLARYSWSQIGLLTRKVYEEARGHGRPPAAAAVPHKVPEQARP